jgi:molecular chaperone DnaK
MLRDQEGSLFLPSLVLFADEGVLVGEEARLRARTQPDRLAACAKLDLGKTSYSHPVGGESFHPEVIQACILSKLRQEVARQVGADFGVVIGVPAYFNDAQRGATADAGEMAGLNVLDILNEPGAAVLAFGEHTPYLAAGAPPLDWLNVLVFDLGGYTFEVTLFHIESRDFQMVRTSHSHHLGLHDWDLRLLDSLAAAFERQHGQDPRADAAGLDHLLATAIRARQALTVRPATTATVRHAGKTLSQRVLREDFDRLTTDLLDSAWATTEKLLAAAGVQPRDVSRVLLVGGATQLPAVHRLIRQRIGREPDCRVHPEEAVARGAALFAQEKLQGGARSGAGPGFKITNVNTHSLGIAGFNLKKGKKVNTILIPRGTPLPEKVTRSFVTRDSGGGSLPILFLEGEDRDPARCALIGKAVIRDLPLHVSAEWPVEVTCEYQASGRIVVDAHVRYTERKVHLEMTRPGSISQADRDKWRSVVTSAAPFANWRAVLHRPEARPPIAVADGGPGPSASVGLLGFLKRFMPIAFGRHGPPHETQTQQAVGHAHEAARAGDQ